MSSLQKTLLKTAQELQSITDIPLKEARLLMAYVLKISHEEVYFGPDRLLTLEEEKAFYSYVKRRLKHEPLSKITGWREFWSLPFRVTQDTLDPRPDSETLIDAVLRYFPHKKEPFRILDLGTGTGCLLLSLLHEYENAWGIGVDRCQNAAQIAQENAHRLQLDKRAIFMVGNWAQALLGPFDIIISNPPYIDRSEHLPPEVMQFDPALALYATENGLASYQAIASHVFLLTAPHTKLFLEIGSTQKNAVISLFSKFQFIEILKDLGKNDRGLVFGSQPISVI